MHSAEAWLATAHTEAHNAKDNRCIDWCYDGAAAVQHGCDSDYAGAHKFVQQAWETSEKRIGGLTPATRNPYSGVCKRNCPKVAEASPHRRGKMENGDCYSPGGVHKAIT